MKVRTSVVALWLALLWSLPVRAAPTISGPVLSMYLATSMGTLRTSVLTITGQGFGTPDLSSSVYVRVGAGTTVLSSDPGVKVWQDGRIVLQISKTITAGTSVLVHAASGNASTTVTKAYQLDWFNLLQPGLAHHMGVDPQGRAWVNPEQRRYISMIDPSQPVGSQVVAIPPPEPDGDPPYAGFYLGNVGRTSSSTNGEDLKIDRNGKVWFPEGGFPTTAADNIPSRNRIFFYDRDAASNNWKVFNLPRDNQSVIGIALAYDQQNNLKRVWYSATAHNTEVYRDPQTQSFYTVTVNEPAKLVSFDPTAICNAPNGSLVCTDGSTFDYTTTINSLVCPPSVQDDTSCFHEYALPNTIAEAAHLVVDVDGSVWFAPYILAGTLGRLIPSTGAQESYPLAQSSLPPYFVSQLWHVFLLPSGDIGFTEYTNASVGRFKRSMLGQPGCLSLDPQTHTNPCLDERPAPFVDDANENVLTADYDAQGNLWYDVSAADVPGTFAGLAYLAPDFVTAVRLPPFSLFPGAGNGFQVSQVAVNRNSTSGEIWTADFQRNRILRIRNG